ncbi:unnamed protein product [Calicophoron daubneyi]|uniref:Protein kinase domain-containing protein n=1 Tax=Calicophoron daubneyi TaxID=300641 RepID=A0AAV2TFZ3_CALDB
MNELSPDHQALILAVPNISQSECASILKDAVICGAGSFGTVYRACWNEKTVAVKCFRKSRSSRRDFQQLAFAFQSEHTNIVKLVAAGPDLPHSFTFAVLEYANCFSVNEVLHNLRDVSYTLAHSVSWTLQASRGADYLHRICEPSIIHGDLKPANMLLFDSGRIVKLSDFGTADFEAVESVRRPGTFLYTAPEISCVKSGDSLQYTDKCDVYSLTVSFWEMLARERPYERILGPREQTHFWTVYKKRPPKLCGCPQLIQDFLDRGWAEDPQLRPSMLKVASFLADVLHKVLGIQDGVDPISIPSELPVTSDELTDQAWEPELSDPPWDEITDQKDHEDTLLDGSVESSGISDQIEDIECFLSTSQSFGPNEMASRPAALRSLEIMCDPEDRNPDE